MNVQDIDSIDEIVSVSIVRAQENLFFQLANEVTGKVSFVSIDLEEAWEFPPAPEWRHEKTIGIFRESELAGENSVLWDFLPD